MTETPSTIWIFVTTVTLDSHQQKNYNVTSNVVFGVLYNTQAKTVYAVIGTENNAGQNVFSWGTVDPSNGTVTIVQSWSQLTSANCVPLGVSTLDYSTTTVYSLFGAGWYCSTTSLLVIDGKSGTLLRTVPLRDPGLFSIVWLQ